jgi:hypothetical protein
LSGLLSRNLPAFDGAKDDEENGAVSLLFNCRKKAQKTVW